MAYLGNAPAEKYISFERQVFTIVNSQTAYTLDHSVTNENDIRLVINNIVQEPGSGKAYTASGTTLTLSAALVNGTDEMYCVFLGRAVGTVNAPAGSVGTSQLASEAVTTAKLADSSVSLAKLTASGTKDATTFLRGDNAFAEVAGGISWQSSIVTASTLSAVVGNGYWIDTTSNTCTITLPGSASVGDQIIFVDYARNWGTNKIIIDSNGLNYQGNPDTFTVEYSTEGQIINIVYSGATKGWTLIEDDPVEQSGIPPATQRAIFAFGDTGSVVGMSNLMDSSGVIGSDVSAVGSSYHSTGATNYGGDKAIYAYGYNGSGATNKSNLVSNLGVVASDATGVGTARTGIAATAYGYAGKAIFGFGYASSVSNISNQVSSAGVIATDSTGVGTARSSISAAMYGGDKGIFAYGQDAHGGDNGTSTSNLVSNVGVISSDVSGVGTARYAAAATSYGGDKAIFGFGYRSGVGTTAISNLVSNTGVVASDTSGVGTVRYELGAASYGGDKGAFAYGRVGSTRYSTKNLISNTGVVASDTTGVGTARSNLKGAEYSFSS